MVDITEISAVVAAAGVLVGVVYCIFGHEASKAGETNRFGHETVLRKQKFYPHTHQSFKACCMHGADRTVG